MANKNPPFCGQGFSLNLVSTSLKMTKKTSGGILTNDISSTLPFFLFYFLNSKTQLGQPQKLIYSKLLMKHI